MRSERSHAAEPILDISTTDGVVEYVWAFVYYLAPLAGVVAGARRKVVCRACVVYFQ